MILFQSVTLKVKVCSVWVPSQPIWWDHWKLIKSAVLLRCVILEEHGKVTLPPISFFKVALRRAVEQAATWSIRNVSGKLSDQMVVTKNGLGKSNSNRNSKLPKSLTTLVPTFDGKLKEFDLFKGLFRMSLKIHNHLTEEDKISYFFPLMRGDTLQTCRNMTSLKREKLGDILTIRWEKRKTQVNGDD